jgi:hypothetical protein
MKNCTYLLNLIGNYKCWIYYIITEELDNNLEQNESDLENSLLKQQILSIESFDEYHPLPEQEPTNLDDLETYCGMKALTKLVAESRRHIVSILDGGHCPPYSIYSN